MNHNTNDDAVKNRTLATANSGALETSMIELIRGIMSAVQDAQAYQHSLDTKAGIARAKRRRLEAAERAVDKTNIGVTE